MTHVDTSMTVEEASEDPIRGNMLKDGSLLVVELDHESDEVQGWIRGYPMPLVE